MESVLDASFALLIGLLLGLERQRSESPKQLFAGIRTFPLLTLAGYVAALLDKDGVSLALPAALLGTAALAGLAYYRTAAVEHGITSEALALLAVLLGALCAYQRATLAAALAVIATLLLVEKVPLHRLADALSREEMLAILKFGVVAGVILPVLPTNPVGPYGAIVPRYVGIVVVILCAISLLGYVLVRLLGKTGWALTGLVGGLVSSTAVTLALSAKARELKHLVRPLAAGILLASMVLYARGLVLTALFDPPLARYLLPRLALLFGVAAAFAAMALRRGRAKGDTGEVGLGNPVDLTHALGLGLLFAAILVLARAAQERMGSAGLWAAGALGGLADVDSVALASAGLHKQGLVETPSAAGSFLIATVTNLAVKSGVVLFAGGRGLAALVLPGFVVLAVLTGVLLYVS